MLAKALVPGGDPVKAGAVADRPFYTPHSYCIISRRGLNSTLDARRSTLFQRAPPTTDGSDRRVYRACIPQ